MGSVSIRRSARLVILDADDRMLLFRYADEHRPPFWSTAGGELLPGETYRSAAQRELHEETGFAAAIGPLLRTRVATYAVARSVAAQWTEQYYLVRTAARPPVRTRWTDEERSTIRDWRWWTLDEMDATTERFLPVWLPELVRAARLPAHPARRRA